MLHASMGRPRLSIRFAMLSIGVAAFIFAGWRWHLDRTPRAQKYRLMAEMHHHELSHWLGYTRLAEKGEASIRNAPSGRTVLCFSQLVPVRRPSLPEEAAVFDRECGETAAVCRAMAAYHADMLRKWQRAASNPWPWLDVAPDPPPPLAIDVSGSRDSIF